MCENVCQQRINCSRHSIKPPPHPGILIIEHSQTLDNKYFSKSLSRFLLEAPIHLTNPVLSVTDAFIWKRSNSFLIWVLVWRNDNFMMFHQSVWDLVCTESVVSVYRSMGMWEPLIGPDKTSKAALHQSQPGFKHVPSSSSKEFSYKARLLVVVVISMRRPFKYWWHKGFLSKLMWWNMLVIKPTIGFTPPSFHHKMTRLFC